MRNWRRRLLLLLTACAVALATMSAPAIPQKDKQDDKKQQKDDKNKQQQDKNKQSGNDVFGGNGKVGLKKSRSSESATAGFNGIGPNGEVEQAMLDAVANDSDYRKLSDMEVNEATSAEVQQFKQEGNLGGGGK